MDSIPRNYKPTFQTAGGRNKPSYCRRNVYQEGRGEILPYIDQILEDHLLSNSRIEGFEHLTELYARALKGESCLLLVEHYSNFDLPVFHYLLRKQGDPGKAIADTIVSIAGIKLSESNPAVNAFAKAYTRLVIYPSRSLEIIKKRFMEPGKLYHEIRRSMAINRAAVKKLAELKAGLPGFGLSGRQRFRPWDPGSGCSGDRFLYQEFRQFRLYINGTSSGKPSGEWKTTYSTR